MKCKQVQEQLEDYSYGELESRLQSDIALHLQACEECSQLLADLAKEARIYSTYAEKIVDRLPLFQFHGRVSSEHSPLRNWGYRRLSPIFAAAVICITIAGTLLTVQDKRDTSFESALRSIERAEQEYLNAITILNAMAEKRRSKLDPKLAGELEQNLRIIDQAIAAASKAYRARPHDPDLAFYMLSAYRKKVELLQELIS